MIRSSASASAASTPAPGGDRDEWENAADGATSNVRAPGAVSIATRPQVSGDVDGAMRAMQGLRILQPPPAGTDDGGNYPLQQQHQQQQFNGSAPVGTATASAHGPLDPVLVAGLENARERMTLLKFEDQIVRFLKNPREPHLNFPPLSSYHRLIVHRLAQRCGLEHQTADYNPYENSSARVVTLFKTPQSAVPRVLLIDLSADRQTPTVTPASAPRIMMRKRSAPRPGANGGRGNADKATPSLQDRERAYAEARARIFGEKNGNTAAESVSSSSSSSTNSSAHEGSGSTGPNVGPRHGSRQATGPDGSRGFGRGRGTPSSGGNGAQSRESRSPKERSSEKDNSEYSRSSHPSAPNAASWKESKVLWRNREQELNDPDFTRHHDAFRPRSSGGASSGSGSGGESPHYGNHLSGGVMGRYGHGDYQFDRSYDRSYGYQHQQTGGAPPPPPPPPPPMPMGLGRGRYHVGGPDYSNRVDTNQYQRSPHQQYHPQQQFQQHQLNPPPSMGRGGYGYPSPQGRPSVRQGNSVPPHANTRAVGNGSGGFIDDDFPPLGK
ncbi:hypothetical protein PHYPSEUDO_003020 [Phytophthora pseudosyringae]|uniref:R3H domain-containing protein n=1 Tax=Phytophthora pseudosyringae TaxID=221518 RepID=A0A8T1VVW1_9STRA|nr:hypothetical protein PHYPSEUDO_003020 [Phytophthora pseudosyringae]